jgi:hypothetical protein
MILPPRPERTHVFPSPLLRESSGMRLSIILIPPEIDDVLAEAEVKAVVGEVEGPGGVMPFRRTIHGRKDGRPYVRFGKTFVGRLGLEDGQPALVELWPDPDPNTALLPIELIDALKADSEAAERFYAFTAGKQRQLATHVSSAKNASTRERRAEEIARKTRTHTLYFDKKR